MVPLKSEVWSDDSFRSSGDDRQRPSRLAGRKTDGQAIRRRRVRSRARKRDNNWFAAMIVVLTLFIVGASVSSFRANIVDAWSQLGGTPYRVVVTVKPGDTLWTYAHRYAAPGSYILDSVDAIARDNDIDPRSTLVPGQKLKIRVDNPVLLTKLQHSARVASAD